MMLSYRYQPTRGKCNEANHIEQVLFCFKKTQLDGGSTGSCVAGGDSTAVTVCRLGGAGAGEPVS
jgi:hypothetical protein